MVIKTIVSWVALNVPHSTLRQWVALNAASQCGGW